MRRARWSIVSSFLFAVGMSCSADQTPSTDPTPHRSAAPTAAATFAVTPPTGYSLRSIGDGEESPTWSDDSAGGVHPAVVLVPEDWRGLDDHRWLVIQSLDGTGNQGGLRQEIPTYLRPEIETSLNIGDRSAVYSEGGPLFDERDTPVFDDVPELQSDEYTLPNPPLPPYLAVDSGADVAEEFGDSDHGFMVSGAGNPSREVLEQVAAAVTHAPPHEPVTVDAPDGWKVIGAFGGNQLQLGYLSEPRVAAEGQRVAHLRADGDNTDRDLQLFALPGSASDVDAFALALSWSPRHGDDAGQPLLRQHSGEEWIHSPTANPSVIFTVDDAVFVLTGWSAVIEEPDLVAELISGVSLVNADVWAASVNAG